jgi:nitronate monooxygenase
VQDHLPSAELGAGEAGGEAGADIMIAQGRDAGGRSGTMRGTIGLVPAVVDAVAPIPVVAAAGLPMAAAWRRR